MRRIPRIRQRDITDCGAACLASVARYYGRAIPVARLRQLASTDRHGTNVLGLIRAAERIGFTAKGFRGSGETLAQLPTPAIVHLVLRGGLLHYVVLYRIRRRHVVIMDPAQGRVRRLPLAEFATQWSGVLVLLTPTARLERGNDAPSPVARLWRLLQPHRSVMMQALVGAVAYTLLGLSTSVFVQKIVDHVLVDGNRELLNVMGIAMVAILTAQALVGALKSVLALRTGQCIDAQLILGYYEHLLALPQQFFDSMRVGEIISRVNDAVKIRSFINETALGLVVNVLVLVFSITLMFCFAPGLALGVLALFPLYGAVFAAANAINRRRQRMLMEASAELESQLVESIGAVTTIRRFNLGTFALRKTETRVVRLLRIVYGSALSAIAQGTATEVLSRLASIALLWAGAGLVLDRALTPGQLMSCYALLGYLTGPLTALVAMNRTAQDAMIAADRLFEIIDVERVKIDDGMRLDRGAAGNVRFRGVHFQYGTRADIFHGLDFVAERGMTTAIVGESGSGKSTIAALLQRLHAVNAGAVSIGDYDVRQISIESLCETIGVVPQHIDLFAATVADNIAVGEAEPDMRRVIDIARAIGIADVIEAMPDGYATMLGERGATLSGGQRQRLAIARALYRDPQILVLDEATAALDAIAEQHVQRVLARLREDGKTVIMIAHRLSTVMRADKIVLIADGRAVEEGTHQQLLAHRGLYHRLWHAQFPSLAAAELGEAKRSA
ncbi:MAG: peptidase domain-containing ABC transporter [Gemmatimonadaceae bacterium]